MIKNRSFEYKKIIVLTIERMQELRELLLKHGDSIEYTAITSNDAEIEFDSFDELCGFNNFGEDKIKSLNLICRKKEDYKFIIDIDFSPEYPKKASVKCKYCFSSVDYESVFISDLEKFLDKTSTFDMKYRICKFIGYWIFLLLGVYPVLIPINGMPYYKTVSGQTILFVVLLIFELTAIGLYSLFVQHILNRLYPRVIYAWGEERERYNRLLALRSNIFWGVIIALLISLAVGLLLK